VIDLSRSSFNPFDHQIKGVEHILSHPHLLLADEMGLGKTKQTIDSACILFERKEINKVLVICPAAVKMVWYDPVFGELRKHLWRDLPSKVGVYGTFKQSWVHCDGDKKLFWIVTNYEYIRQDRHLANLLSWVDYNTMIVLDESSYVKTSGAKQTKACMKLRSKVDRILLLNGTPVTQSPLDLFAQGNLIDRKILQCRYKTHFIAQYAVTAGQFRKPVAWPGLPELRERFRPYVLRRLKKNCLDLPKKLPSVVMPVKLSNQTWKKYKDMRDDLIAELESGDIAVANHAVTKLIRLSQITSGILTTEGSEEPVIFSNEKRDSLMDWYRSIILSNPEAKILIWSRFRKEVEAIYDTFLELPSPPVCGKLYGGQKVEERRRTLQLLEPRTAPKGSAIVIGTPHTGKVGLNMAAASIVIYISNDYSLFARIQSEDRVHRPGQVNHVSYFDYIASGPNGQYTIDWTILQALKQKRDVAKWTAGHWVTELKKEAA